MRGEPASGFRRSRARFDFGTGFEASVWDDWDDTNEQETGDCAPAPPVQSEREHESAASALTGELIVRLRALPLPVPKPGRRH
jgi:hypothetical protein